VKENINNIIVKYFSGRVNEEERLILLSWLEESTENKAYFEKQRAVWLMTGIQNKDLDKKKKKVWKKINSQDRSIDFLSRSKPNLSGLNRIIAAAAVISILLAIGAIIVSLNSNLSFEGVRIVRTDLSIDTLKIYSPSGSRTQVDLPDGSKVWLNGDSRIGFHTKNNKRIHEVFLSGEAYFDIAKKSDKQKFIVNTSDILIEVHGTSFNVKAYPEEGIIETTLAEGQIKMRRNSNRINNGSITLMPDQQVLFIKDNSRISREKMESLSRKFNIDLSNEEKAIGQFLSLQDVNTELYSAWKDGHLVFQGETFQSIIIEFERWYGVDIELNNEKLKDITFTANFKNETLNQALHALMLTHPFEFSQDIEKNKYIIE